MVKMKFIINKKLTVQLISIACVTLIITPVCNAGVKTDDVKTESKKKISGINEKIEKFNPTNRGTEYWALLVAVGVYLNHPSQNRPSMLEAVDNLHEALLDSPLWSEDHIHILKGEEATMRNLIRELIWLILKEDKNDMSLVYITTHGYPLKNEDDTPMDIPPKDEDDGADESLIMYEGFEYWYGNMWDDLLNFLLSLLQSQGVCLIVDSCYSGGFNDDPMFIGGLFDGYTAESFSQGFLKEVGSQGRVVLMSCEEDEVSWGSLFSGYLTQGFLGAADLFGNGDGINSAEEAFNYAEPRVKFLSGGDQCPTMLDLYPGEYPVTFS
jgi:hypothetical protein